MGSGEVTVIVAEATQVNHQGTVYGPGKRVRMPAAESERLEQRGLVTRAPVEDTSSAKAKAKRK